MRRFLVIVSLCSVLGGAFLLGEQLWLLAKASLARSLIDRAFAAHIEDGGVHRPWSWADTHPIARLEVPRLGIRRTVLSGASGSSMAFGPGHVDGTVPPNRPGNSVVAGHRDSWFSFLAELRRGDAVWVETRGSRSRYVVTDLGVHADWDTTILEPTEDDRLTLVTCFPFGVLEPATRRYVVTARLLPPLG